MAYLGFSARARNLALSTGCAALLAACGGGGGSASSSGTATPTPTPAPTSACALTARKSWALSQLQEWYLFPDLLNSSANAAAYSSIDDYIDALVAPARAQYRDRYFTYLTSIKEEDAYYGEGETAGFGIRFELDPSQYRLYASEVFEGTPALAAGIDRGSEILQITIPGGSARNVRDILISGGTPALVNALGPDTAGTTRVVKFRTSAGEERTVNLAKADYKLDPVSDIYGAKIITDGEKQVGYINLRTFIDTAAPDLRAAFAAFKAQGMTELIIDLRYNGGGLISIAALMGDLMGEGRSGQVFSQITLRESKASLNSAYLFEPRPESITPTKVAFIATGSTASASELVINGMVPYLGTNMALIGGNTYGKPVGQMAFDREACDDRLRIVALKVENADQQGEYYSGLATTVPTTCRASDDITYQLGDPEEGMVRAALDYLGGRSCSPILTASATASVGTVRSQAARVPLIRDMPRSAPQHELPGAF